jgi:UDP-3-O-acyl-N-acetylglucosamine deacetylase
MSAIAGVGITDAVVEFDGPEVPILDGSAIGFVREFRRVGVCDLGAETDPIVLTDAIDLIGPSEERLIAVPAEHFSVTVVIEYRDRPSIGIQAASFAPGIDFDREVAEARTYGFLSELEAVKRMGLALGASLENCIALLDDGSPDPRTPLRYGNELARHKLLDVIGDLALVGKPIHAQVVALRPSHAVNSGLARRLAHQ